MLNSALIKDVLDVCLSTGGDFAELFLENNRCESLTMRNGVLENSLSGIDYGCGLRIFNGLNSIYAFTNDTSRENLQRVAQEAAAAIGSGKTVSTMDFVKREAENRHIIKIDPFDVSKKEKVSLLRLAHETAMGYSGSISQTLCLFTDYVQDVLIANTEGLWVEDRRVRGRAMIQSVASSANEKQVGYFGPGAHAGYSFFEELDIKAIATKASSIAVTMLNADPCPSGRMPVIISNAFGGVIFHEACGHSLEATSVAKGSSVFCDKLEQQIAAPCVTAIDDGTIPNAWGSLNVDDEGTPTQRNVLIENGTLKSYLIDKLNGKRMGMQSTGSARRESYKFAPTSRMTNTFIDNGKSTVDEIVANTEYGLYASQMGGGSVEPATGEFNFAVLEGYMVRNGKIAEPVRGATLIGKGHEVLMNIDMVADNLSRAQGMCGSLSGSVPTDVGQPMIRVKELTVGGRR